MAPGRAVGGTGKGKAGRKSAAGKAGKPAAKSGFGIARGGQGGRAGKAGSARKGAAIGSGGLGKKRLEGRGPTPPAEVRTGHPKARAKARTERGVPARGRDGTRGRATARDRDDAGRPARSLDDTGGARPARPARRAEVPETVAGRNAVVEALAARVPAASLLVARGIDHDQRVRQALRLALDQRLPMREVARAELDRATNGAVHQGLALTVPPYDYAHPDDLLAAASRSGAPALVVALDGVTDPHNLGAIARSAAAFGAHGVVVPERRSATVTAAVWKSSAGAVARLPVALATNLTRTLRAYAAAGLMIVGLDAAGAVTVDELELASDPLVLVVGAEGTGLSRLVGEACDMTVRIGMTAETESLNASVAAGVALAAIARRRSRG